MKLLCSDTSRLIGRMNQVSILLYPVTLQMKKKKKKKHTLTYIYRFSPFRSHSLYSYSAFSPMYVLYSGII